METKTNNQILLGVIYDYFTSITEPFIKNQITHEFIKDDLYQDLLDINPEYYKIRSKLSTMLRNFCETKGIPYEEIRSTLDYFVIYPKLKYKKITLYPEISYTIGKFNFLLSEETGDLKIIVHTNDEKIMVTPNFSNSILVSAHKR